MYKSVLMTVLNLVQGQMYSKNLADSEMFMQYLRVSYMFLHTD